MSFHGMESQGHVKLFRTRFSNKTYPCDPGLHAAVHQCCHDPLAHTTLPVLWQNHEVLNIPIRHAICNDTTHTDRPAGICFNSNSKGKAAQDQAGEIFGLGSLFPPFPGHIKGSYLFFVPRTDNHHGDVFCHKQSYPVIQFKQFPKPQLLNHYIIVTILQRVHQDSKPSRVFWTNELSKGGIHNCTQTFNIPVP